MPFMSPPMPLYITTPESTRYKSKDCQSIQQSIRSSSSGHDRYCSKDTRKYERSKEQHKRIDTFVEELLAFDASDSVTVIDEGDHGYINVGRNRTDHKVAFQQSSIEQKRRIDNSDKVVTPIKHYSHYSETSDSSSQTKQYRFTSAPSDHKKGRIAVNSDTSPRTSISGILQSEDSPHKLRSALKKPPVISPSTTRTQVHHDKFFSLNIIQPNADHAAYTKSRFRNPFAVEDGDHGNYCIIAWRSVACFRCRRKGTRTNTTCNIHYTDYSA